MILCRLLLLLPALALLPSRRQRLLPPPLHSAAVGSPHARALRSAPPGSSLERGIPSSGLRGAPELSKTEWSALQAEADRALATEQASLEECVARGAALLVASVERRLGSVASLAEEEALAADCEEEHDVLEELLEEQAPLAGCFVSGERGAHAVSDIFQQADHHLQRLHRVGGESPSEKAARDEWVAVEAMAALSPPFREALSGSALLARRRFAQAVRFGYFLRHSRQRWALEQSVCGRTVADLGGYLEAIRPEDVVELVRLASREAALAVELRASALFGDSKPLSEALMQGPGALTPFDSGGASPARLQGGAVAFGAALFEAEREAAREYSLTYTAFGCSE